MTYITIQINANDTKYSINTTISWNWTGHVFRKKEMNQQMDSHFLTTMT